MVRRETSKVPPPKIEDEHVALSLSLLVQTVGDGGSGGLVDDPEHIETSNQTSILGGLTLRVVEVGGDCDDGIVDGAAQVGLGGLPHLDQDHGGDLLGSEVLGLALELDLDDGLPALVNDLEGKCFMSAWTQGHRTCGRSDALRRRRCSMGSWRPGSWRHHR